MENKPYLQLIFVTESKRDYPYISTTVKTLFDCSNNIRLDNVPMNGKHKYSDGSVRKRIKDKKRGFAGTSVVIYCFDTDDIFNDIEHVDYVKKIEKYCHDNNYELIWFCRTIEEVFIGKLIKEDNEKEKVMKSFLRKNKISENISLNCDEKYRKRTNLLNVVGKYCKKSRNDYFDN